MNPKSRENSLREFEEFSVEYIRKKYFNYIPSPESFINHFVKKTVVSIPLNNICVILTLILHTFKYFFKIFYFC